MKQFVCTVVIGLMALSVMADDVSTATPDSLSSDSINSPAIATALTDTIAATPQNSNIFRRVYDWAYNYIDTSNDVKENKKFDWSVLAGPKYSSSRSFGIAAVASAIYRMEPGDTLTPESNIALTVNASLTGFYELSLEGVSAFKGDRMRLNYVLNFMSERSKFWGIGYDMASNDANESKYSFRQGIIMADFEFKLADTDIYLGPAADYTYNGARRQTNPELWEGLPDHTNSFGLGLNLLYDTRDHLSNSYRGVYLALAQRFYPRLTNGNNCFSSTELTFKYFHPLWKGCIFAGCLQGKFTYGHTPWGMLPSFGGSRLMRGYYEGRYRDKDMIDATVELRQHVWKRSGVVAWVGAGTVFPEFSALRWHKVLPNYGIGYRFEFKHRINLRVDVGFGRGEKSIELSINEAF